MSCLPQGARSTRLRVRRQAAHRWRRRHTELGPPTPADARPEYPVSLYHAARRWDPTAFLRGWAL